MSDARTAAEVVFRSQYGRIMATLIRITGSFVLAEEAIQEAFTSALATWPERGIPENGGAWITASAHRKAIDRLRHERTRREKQDQLTHETEDRTEPAYDEIFEAAEMPYPDDRLRLILTCCHPALKTEAKVALTPRTLCRLATPEVVRAFLIP